MTNQLCHLLHKPERDSFLHQVWHTEANVYQLLPDNLSFTFSYQIMLECWSVNPDERPLFADLVNSLELLINPPEQQPSSDDGEPLYMNRDHLVMTSV